MALVNDPAARQRRQALGHAYAKAMPDDEQLGLAFIEAAGLAKPDRQTRYSVS